MPRFRARAWGVLVEFTWGVVDELSEGLFWNNTQPNSESAAIIEKTIKIGAGGAITHGSKELLKNVISGATHNLMI